MTGLRRLDHVGIVVRDTVVALRWFEGQLGLRVAHTEDLDVPPVRLTYLDAGNAWIQLVQPLDADSDVARRLDADGEGVDHICFATDDVFASAQALSNGQRPTLGSGRGRTSAFAGIVEHGVRIECTQFSFADDVGGRPGWLPGPAPGAR